MQLWTQKKWGSREVLLQRFFFLHKNKWFLLNSAQQWGCWNWLFPQSCLAPKSSSGTKTNQFLSSDNNSESVACSPDVTSLRRHNSTKRHIFLYLPCSIPWIWNIRLRRWESHTQSLFTNYLMLSYEAGSYASTSVNNKGHIFIKSLNYSTSGNIWSPTNKWPPSRARKAYSRYLICQIIQIEKRGKGTWLQRNYTLIQVKKKKKHLTSPVACFELKGKICINSYH